MFPQIAALVSPQMAAPVPRLQDFPPKSPSRSPPVALQDQRAKSLGRFLFIVEAGPSKSPRRSCCLPIDRLLLGGLPIHLPQFVMSDFGRQVANTPLKSTIVMPDCWICCAVGLPLLLPLDWLATVVPGLLC
jgi:hypothetical protein